MVPNIEYTYSAEKVRDTVLDDENASQDMTSILVTPLGKQPEAEDTLDDLTIFSSTYVVVILTVFNVCN